MSSGMLAGLGALSVSAASLVPSLLPFRSYDKWAGEPVWDLGADRGEIVAGHDRDHAGSALGHRRTDRNDPRVGVRAPQKRDIAEMGDVEIVGVAAPALGEPLGVAARRAAPDPAACFAHGFAPARARATASTASTIA